MWCRLGDFVEAHERAILIGVLVGAVALVAVPLVLDWAL